MKVLITGAAGFIGSLLTAQLYENGYDFVATDVVNEPESLHDLLGKIQYESLDLSSPGQIKGFIEKHRPSHIVHAAGIMGGVAELDPPFALQVNFMSTAHLVQAGMQNGLERFVLATTIGVYDPATPEPIRDDSLKRPANIYGLSKLSSEYLLEWYSSAHGLSVGGARLPWVFGPGRSRGLTADLSTKLLDAIARGEQVHVSAPYERGDWMYGPDGARALMTMLDPGDKQKQFAYYFSGAGVYTVREVMEHASRLCPEAKLTFADSKNRAANYAAAFDDSTTKTDLGWEPEYNLDKAINAHIAVIQKAETGQAGAA
jgi:UDP-glucose 4-epimerase